MNQLLTNFGATQNEGTDANFIDGAMCFRTDTNTLYQVSAGSFVEFFDFDAVKAQGNPDVSFTSGGTYQGKMSLSSVGGVTTWTLYDSADAVVMTFSNDATNKNIWRGHNANGIEISSLNAAYRLALSDTETSLESGSTLKLKSGTLQLQDALTDTVGPLLSIGNASAGANQNLATDASGRIVASALPAGNFIGLTDTPSSYGTAGQSVIVNPAADGLIFGAASGGAGTPAMLDVDPLQSIFTPSRPATVMTIGTEYQINIASSAIDADHPFTVASNEIRVDSGTEDFQAILDYVIDIDPTSWVTTASDGANRFLRRDVLEEERDDSRRYAPRFLHSRR